MKFIATCPIFQTKAIPSPSFSWGGMLSSSEDLALLSSAGLGGDFLSEASRDILFTSQHLSDGSETGYGFGWFVDMDKFLDARTYKLPKDLYLHLKEIIKGRDLIWHSGTSSGVTAMLILPRKAML
jgi:hypothetical protein